jgi:hypothetical protein
VALAHDDFGIAPQQHRARDSKTELRAGQTDFAVATCQPSASGVAKFWAGSLHHPPKRMAINNLG